MPTHSSQGGCLCGEIRYKIATATAGALDIATLPGSYCHCSMCRKSTGGGYAAFVSVPRHALRWTRGTPALYRSSPIARRGFCATCGSPLFYDASAEDHLAILVGSLDDPSGFRADHHDGIESRLPWADCAPGLPGHETTERFEGQPP